MRPKNVFWVTLLTVAFSAFVPNRSFAQAETECPKSISVLGENFLSSQAITIIKHVYQELGCGLRVITFPGRRGFLQFNNGVVDGELYRLPIGPENYTRPYVGSEVPLFTISNSLWAAPTTPAKSIAPIGYTLGVVWQKSYLEAHNLRGIAYRNTTDLLSDYQKGALTRFLGEDNNVHSYIRKNQFKRNNIPVQRKVVKVGELNHYLGAEFTPFMKRFSAYLIEHKPFASLSAPNQLSAKK